MSGVKGKSGRKPIPLKIHRLRGSYRPCRHDDRAEPAFPAGLPEAPKWLKGQPKALWDELSPILQRAGVLTTADRTALTALCLAWGRFLAAETAIAEQGLTVTTPDGGTKTNPAVSIGNIAWGQVTKGLAQFGLSPLDRPNIRPLPAAEPSIEDLLESTRDIWDTRKRKPRKGRRNAG